MRPGQDCAEVYGHRVVLFRVEQLDDEGYREVEVGVIEPDWLKGNLGTHTFNFDSRYETVDGRVRVMRGLRLRHRRLAAT